MPVAFVACHCCCLGKHMTGSLCVHGFGLGGKFVQAFGIRICSISLSGGNEMTTAGSLVLGTLIGFD